ncbi:hypothetical protein RvY_12996 [Ramazzottius varieornatus]|uniref:Uncharacterized protein n=1 Tax=Ramazzottius varieornatus TaxID=947166 RepID=A0A1D1VRS1_RAMVA|nr:hypothetical protein RvY_12996 [Ramazzottius varieornatus]
MKTLIYLIMGFCHNYLRSMAQEYSTGLGDTDIPVDVDTPINSTVVSLSRVFPTGTDFTITSLNFISRSTGDSEDVAVFSFNSTENTLRSQEPLTRFLGGVFRMRVTVVFNDTGIEVGEEIRLPVVDKTHCLRMVLKDGGLAAEGVERQELDMLHQLRNAVDMHGRNLLLVPEYKSHGLYPTAKQATSR